MTDLVEWLEAQLAEDERIAREAIPDGGTGDWCELHHCPHDDGDTVPPSHDLCARIGLWGDELFLPDEGGHSPEQARHIVQHDPRSVLALVAAHRLILFYHSGNHECSGPDDNAMWICDDVCPTVRALASAYAARPGYDPSWGPDGYQSEWGPE
jgi:hypothetical protein